MGSFPPAKPKADSRLFAPSRSFRGHDLFPKRVPAVRDHAPVKQPATIVGCIYGQDLSKFSCSAAKPATLSCTVHSTVAKRLCLLNAGVLGLGPFLMRVISCIVT